MEDKSCLSILSMSTALLISRIFKTVPYNLLLKTLVLLLTSDPFYSFRAQLSTAFLREAFTQLPKVVPLVIGFQSDILLLYSTCLGYNFTHVFG